eukprot:TRINITY_DN3279_c2_g1_i1.p1 TRINITY_DN3279_c2_g1~~TRINITY_DN3279_c2_g1_i1.p1  ORF type:complete len:227 (+),score=77.28 TRINITY_DN3279_c2_g1_i1:451-1131(+)
MSGEFIQFNEQATEKEIDQLNDFISEFSESENMNNQIEFAQPKVLKTKGLKKGSTKVQPKTYLNWLAPEKCVPAERQALFKDPVREEIIARRELAAKLAKQEEEELYHLWVQQNRQALRNRLAHQKTVTQVISEISGVKPIHAKEYEHIYPIGALDADDEMEEDIQIYNEIDDFEARLEAHQEFLNKNETKTKIDQQKPSQMLSSSMMLNAAKHLIQAKSPDIEFN